MIKIMKFLQRTIIIAQILINFSKKEKRNKNHTKKSDDKISTKSLSNDKIRLNIKNNTKNYSFSNLDTNRSSSFTINSIYDNINQISKYKYHQDSDLREKTKMFILKEINKEHKISNTHIYKKKNNSVLDIKANNNNKEKIRTFTNNYNF